MKTTSSRSRVVSGQSPEIRHPPSAIPLEDIRTVADNAALAQQLFGFIKQLTADPDTALHCSIAGGRKTMSAYLALALTLYGRQQDTLSHVLVSEEFESNPKFFFPTKRSQTIAIRRGNEWDVGDTKTAQVELAEVPFVRLREHLGEWFTALDQTVEEIIQTAQHELELTRPPADLLVIDISPRQVRFGDTPIPIGGVHLALYLYLAETKLHHCTRPDLPTWAGCTDCYQSFQQMDQSRLIETYRRVYPYSAGNFNEWEAKTQKKIQSVGQAHFKS